MDKYDEKILHKAKDELKEGLTSTTKGEEGGKIYRRCGISTLARSERFCMQRRIKGLEKFPRECE